MLVLLSIYVFILYITQYVILCTYPSRTYVHTHIHKHTHMYAHTHTHTDAHTHKRTQSHAHTHTHTHTGISFLCVGVCMYLYFAPPYVFMHVCAFVYVHV